MGVMRLPDFIVAGARKCGTTWLHSCLAEHPQIFLPKVTKELFFYDRYWGRGVDWYARYFENCPVGKICGEVSPTYLKCSATAERLRDTVPNAKLIFVLRDPIARAVSMYHHLRMKGDTTAPFADALVQYPELIEEGLYAQNLQPFLATFPRSQILILLYEKIQADPSDALDRIYSFIGADPAFVPPSLTQRTYGRRRPRMAGLAKMASGASRAMHRAGLHRIVNIAKKAGAGRMVYQEADEPVGDDVLPATRQNLRTYFKADIEMLQSQLAFPLTTLWDLASADVF